MAKAKNRPNVHLLAAAATVRKEKRQKMMGNSLSVDELFEYEVGYVHGYKAGLRAGKRRSAGSET